MSQVQRYACDGCGRLVENPLSTEGWFRVEGRITRYTGKYNGTGYEAHIRTNGDYCSEKCFSAISTRGSRVIRNTVEDTPPPPVVPPIQPAPRVIRKVPEVTTEETPTRAERLKEEE